MLHRRKYKLQGPDGRNEENGTGSRLSPPGYQWGRSNVTIYVHVHESRHIPTNSKNNTIWYKALFLLPNYGRHGKDKENGRKGSHRSQNTTEILWKPHTSWWKIIGKMTKKTTQVSCPSHHAGMYNRRIKKISINIQIYICSINHFFSTYSLHVIVYC